MARQEETFGNSGYQESGLTLLPRPGSPALNDRKDWAA